MSVVWASMGSLPRNPREVAMGRLHALASRVWFHVATLLEKPNVPGVLPLTISAIGIVLAYLVLISFR